VKYLALIALMACGVPSTSDILHGEDAADAGYLKCEVVCVADHDGGTPHCRLVEVIEVK